MINFKEENKIRGTKKFKEENKIQETRQI